MPNTERIDERGLEYDSTGQMPDALSFANPRVTGLWLVLEDIGEPVRSTELVEEVDVSMATIHRYLDDLETLGLLETEHRVSNPQRPLYYSVWPDDTDTDIPRKVNDA